MIPNPFKEATPVEYKNNQTVSYMDNKAYSIFKKLQETEMIIPVTTRSLSQFNRLDFLKKCKFAIASNGGVILKDGKILEEWSEITKNNLKDFNISFLKSIFENFNLELEIRDNSYLTCLLESETRNEVENALDKENVIFTIQGNRLYIIPKKTSKENALKYLLENFFSDSCYLLTSGDGKLDKGFVEMGNKQFIPKNSELHKILSKKSKKQIIIKNNFEGERDLLNKIKKEFKK